MAVIPSKDSLLHQPVQVICSLEDNIVLLDIETQTIRLLVMRKIGAFEQAGQRTFFLKEENKLVCLYFTSKEPVQED